MPNLDEQAATAWFADVRPLAPADAWPPAIRAIEATEDGPALLTELGELLDDMAVANAPSLTKTLRQEPLRSELQSVMAQAGAARALRILHWIGEAGITDSHQIVAALMASSTAEARALRAAVATVTRRAALHRMFSAKRITALQSAATTAFKEIA